MLVLVYFSLHLSTSTIFSNPVIRLSSATTCCFITQLSLPFSSRIAPNYFHPAQPRVLKYVIENITPTQDCLRFDISLS